ncbi:MAG: argininosuccinate lyase [Acidobacteria bacterium]|nr:argininosuccinate lyase [Acidobacteriota bacterium]
MPRKKLWGGRFGADEDPFFAEFNDSLSFDRELLDADIEASMAYARALERAGVFSRKERMEVEKGLRTVLEENRSDPEQILRSNAEDVHTYVEEALGKKVGALALKLHTGRSRNDQVATDLRLYLRRKAELIGDALEQLLEALADFAERCPSVIIPGYTHLQRAQPVLFSHYLLAYGEMLLRDRQRLREAVARIGIMPLGSGALSGTVYAVDRTALARDLGFSTPTENSMDGVSDRDFVLDFLYFASVLMMHLSRFSEDLILYNSSEFSFLQLDDSIASGSSLMPQKKNPDALELVRGKTGRVYGHLFALLTVMKGLPMTYNKDLQEDKEALFDAVRTVENCVRMIRKVVENMRVNPERMMDAAKKGYLNATELADYLVSKQMPFREAHTLVGKIVVRAAELGITLEEMPLREYQSFSPLFDEGLYEFLDLSRAISRRSERGGTAQTAVRRSIRLLRKQIRTGVARHSRGRAD